jgi:hypothetical protein
VVTCIFYRFDPRVDEGPSEALDVVGEAQRVHEATLARREEGAKRLVAFQARLAERGAAEARRERLAREASSRHAMKVCVCASVWWV